MLFLAQYRTGTLFDATMASRGGGHRRKVENVDLIDVLEDHVKSHGLSRAMQFGIYENIDRTQAAFAAGLAYNKDLLMKAATNSDIRLYQQK